MTPNGLISGVAYKFQWELCNESFYDGSVRHLNVIIGKNISILPLTKKQYRPKNSSVADHLLFCIQHALTILVFYAREQIFFTSTKRQSVINDEKSIIFE